MVGRQRAVKEDSGVLNNVDDGPMAPLIEPGPGIIVHLDEEK